MVLDQPYAQSLPTPSTQDSGLAHETSIEVLECAICFECVDHRTTLPCACKVDYCPRCWDRCLAQSFNSCGCARCPTCRLPVRVDYDANAGRLMFSPAEHLDSIITERSADPSSFLRERERIGSLMLAARTRLIEQARPAQIKILKEHGTSSPLAAPLVERLLADSPQQIPEGLELQEQPHCVCGGRLEVVTYRERAGRICQRQFARCPEVGTPEYESLVDFFLERAGEECCSCDVCGANISSVCWTCENGSNTILHASAYDVCAKCFALHCHDLSIVPQNSEISASDENPTSMQDASIDCL